MIIITSQIARSESKNNSENFNNGLLKKKAINEVDSLIATFNKFMSLPKAIIIETTSSNYPKHIENKIT